MEWIDGRPTVSANCSSQGFSEDQLLLTSAGDLNRLDCALGHHVDDVKRRISLEELH